jgi:hypothetical protein
MRMMKGKKTMTLKARLLETGKFVIYPKYQL